MVRQRRSSLNGRGIADFDEFIIKNSHITLRSCLIAFCFDPTTLIEIAVYTHVYGEQDINFVCFWLGCFFLNGFEWFVRMENVYS